MIREEHAYEGLTNTKISADDLAFNHKMDISASMYRRMKELGMTQVQLAQKMGIDQGRISKIITGKQNLTVSTLAKIEVALGFNLDSGFRYTGATSFNLVDCPKVTTNEHQWDSRKYIKESRFVLIDGGVAA
ncbi:helix-turn-helix domain-containing protein [Olegusella massiliensis]|uniref:helix-turn-helix domain-containing protein n=1 Tax=Olegusella massiliensis TaxID=1776381 RepID=UPI004055779F